MSCMEVVAAASRGVYGFLGLPVSGISFSAIMGGFEYCSQCKCIVSVMCVCLVIQAVVGSEVRWLLVAFSIEMDR